MPASLRAFRRRENAARVSLQTQHLYLSTISFRVNAKSVGDGQTRLTHTREIRSLRAKPSGVGGFGSRERKYKSMHVGLRAGPLAVVGISRHGIHYRDLFHREIGNNLHAVFVDDQHFFNMNAPLKGLPMLRLERKDHAFLDLDGMIERPDARDQRLIVLRQPK